MESTNTKLFKRFILIVILFLAFIFFVYAAGSDSGDFSEWLMFGRTLNHTRYYPANFNMANFVLKWNSTITIGSVASSPAIANNILYVGDYASKVYAINTLTGAKLWNFNGDNNFAASSTIFNGVVYIGDLSGNMYALNATNGTQIWKWNFTIGINNPGAAIYSPSAVSSKGILYFGSFDNRTYALNATNGAHIWNYTTGGSMSYSGPAIFGDVVYIGSTDNRTYALNATNGTQIWNYTTGNNIQSSPTVSSNGILYIGSTDSKIYALNATNGTQIWNFTTGAQIYSSSAAILGGIVYIASVDGKVYALNATNGTQIWNYQTGDTIYFSSPTVTTNGILFIGSNDKNIYALNATNGTVIWNYTAGDTFGSASIVNNVVYISNNDGNIYAFSGDNDAPLVSAINSPVSGGNYSQLLLLNASVNDTNSGVSSVYFNVSNSSYSTFNKSFQLSAGSLYWNCTINTTYYADGLWNVTIFANDSANNQNNTVSILNIKFDNTAPNLTLSLNASNTTTTAITAIYGCSDTLSGMAACYLSSSGGTVSGNVISGLSCGTSYTITVTGNDTAGNSNSTNTSMATSTCPVASSSGGGGGGGGGPTITNISISSTNTWSTMIAGQIYNYVLSNPNIAIDKVSITPKESLSNVRIVVRQLTEIPSIILKAPMGILYKYLEIAKENILNSQLKEVTITFSVDKTWVDAHGDKNNILMLKYSNNLWEKLPTKFVSLVGNQYRYEAVTTGFSYFAIVYLAPVAKPLVTTTPTANEAAAAQVVITSKTVPTTAPSAKKTNWLPITIVLVCVLVVGLFAYFIYKKKQGENLRAYRDKSNRK